MPPSITDIGGAILTIGALNEAQSDRIAWKVADPVGIWRFAPDRRHPAFGRILSLLRFVEAAARELGEREDVRALAEKHRLADRDPRFFLGFLQARIKDMAPASRALIEKIIDADKKMYEDPAIKTIIDIESSRAGFAPDAPELDMLCEAYAKIGVALEFQTYK